MMNLYIHPSLIRIAIILAFTVPVGLLISRKTKADPLAVIFFAFVYKLAFDVAEAVAP